MNYPEEVLLNDMRQTGLPRATLDRARKAAEQTYTTNAFNYPEAPIGSRDWTIFWWGWLSAESTEPTK